MPSHAIRDCAYDGERHELTVTFTSGRVYVYSLVRSDVAAALGAAVSKGAFFNQHIRDCYPFRKAKTEQKPAASLREALIRSS